MNGALVAFSQPATIITLSVLVAIIIAIIVFRIFHKKQMMASLSQGKAEQPETTQAPSNDEQPAEPPTVRLGEGDYKCMAFRKNNVIDFTSITEPVGEIYLADASCPLKGGIYIVKELANGEIVDYDPRKVPILNKQTPDDAYSATHWPECKRYWTVPLSWLKSPSTWFAGATLIIFFIVSMIFFGG